jgi:hypothetical protein
MPGGSEHDSPQHPELPMGGNVPLGYDVKDRKLVVNEPEASTGRVIFGRYAELRSVALLRAELDQQDIVSKRREGARVVRSRPRCARRCRRPAYKQQDPAQCGDPLAGRDHRGMPDHRD